MRVDALRGLDYTLQTTNQSWQALKVLKLLGF